MAANNILRTSFEDVERGLHDSGHVVWTWRIVVLRQVCVCVCVCVCVHYSCL